MFLIHLAYIIVVLDPVQFFGWVALCCICTGIVLDGSVTQLQCSTLCIKRIMNRVPVYAITLNVNLK